MIGPELDLTKTAFLNLFFKIILFLNGFFGKGTVKILSTERENFFLRSRENWSAKEAKILSMKEWFIVLLWFLTNNNLYFILMKTMILYRMVHMIWSKVLIFFVVFRKLFSSALTIQVHKYHCISIKNQGLSVGLWIEPAIFRNYLNKS